MLGVALSGRPSRFTDVAIFAWLAIETSAVVVVNYTVCVEFFYFATIVFVSVCVRERDRDRFIWVFGQRPKGDKVL